MGKDHGAAMKNYIAKKIKYITIITLLFAVLPCDVSADNNGAYPGAFSRMGFGARGIAMGNAVNAVTLGAVGSYYNPATIAFTEVPTFDASMGLLSLDRSLNFLHFTTHIPPSAGFSVSVINAGVSDIDGRNRDGVHTGYLSTSENLFSFGFGIQFNKRFAAGIAFKLFYFNLYDDMSSTTVGLDMGLLYKLNNQITLAANIKDINSKYKWDSTPLYEQRGRTTTDDFPLLYQIGGSYLSQDETLLISMQGEYSGAYNFILRAGVEAYMTENIILRGGIEDMTNDEENKPSLGIGIRYPVGDWLPSFNYTLVFEPNAPSSYHVFSVGIEF